MSRVTQKTVEAYERNAELFEKRLSQAGRRAAEPTFLRTARALWRPGGMILDLGCGSGHDALLLARRGFHVIGVDATPTFIKRARARVGRAQCRFEISDMLTWRSTPASLDGVWANASLIHVPKNDLPGLLKRVRRWLRPGGIFAATLHNGRADGFSDRTWIPGRFFASYLKDELADLVTAAGFEILTLRRAVNEDRKGRWLNLVATPRK